MILAYGFIIGIAAWAFVGAVRERMRELEDEMRDAMREQGMDWCDGCGHIMHEQPLVKWLHGDLSMKFDTFKCYERTRDAVATRERIGA